MIVKTEAKFLRISPSKARRAIALLRGEDVVTAQAIVLHLSFRAQEYIKKILDSAVANAKVKGFKPEQLYVSKAVCNMGPTWKRYKAAAFGRATLIRRRTSHIKIELDLKK